MSSSRVSMSSRSPFVSRRVVRDRQPRRGSAVPGGATQVGNFSEQVWGESRERRHEAAVGGGELAERRQVVLLGECAGHGDRRSGRPPRRARRHGPASAARVRSSVTVALRSPMARGGIPSRSRPRRRYGQADPDPHSFVRSTNTGVLHLPDRPNRRRPRTVTTNMCGKEGPRPAPPHRAAGT